MSKVAITGIDIHTYLVKDAERAKAFWIHTMGLTPTWQSEQGAEFDLADGSTFGLWKLGEGEGEWYAGGGLMFAVPDVNEAVAHYRGLGVPIVHVEETPVCWMAFAADSEGNGFVLHQRKTDAKWE